MTDERPPRDEPPRDEPHRKKRRAIDEPSHAHFFTFSCYRRAPLLDADRSRRWLVDAIDAARRSQDWDVWAYVIMPEHVHLLAFPNCAIYRSGRFLAAIKRPVSVRAREHLARQGETQWLDYLTVQRGNMSTFRYWQAGTGYDVNLWNDRPIRATIDYIHANPVRRGLCERPTDWKWSSARWYEDMTASGPLTPDRYVANW